MATPTSSSNRSKRKGTKPITQGQNPQRGNRQKVSNAQVTNSNTRGSNAGSAKVTSSSSPAASKPAPVQRRTRVNGKVKPGMVPRNQVGQPKPQRQGPTTSNVPPRATPQPPAKPSGNFKAPSIPKPGKPAAKPPVSGVRRVGGGLVSGTILTAAAGKAIETLGRAAQPGEWNRVQRELQARGYGGRKPVNNDPNGRSSTGVRVSDKANQRDYKAAPTGSQQYNDYRNQQLAAERDRLKGVGNPSKAKPKPPAELPRRQESGSGSQRSAAPQTTKPAMPGRKWDDFNPGRGTSKSNNPLLDRDSGGMKLRDRMKQREDAQRSESSKNLKNNFGQDSGYETKTKVDGSKYADKKPDMKKVKEYDRLKRRYYD